MSKYRQSKSHEKALDEYQSIFKYADSHPSTVNFRLKAFEDYGFYDGTRQWPQSVINELRKRGQDPVVINKIKNIVNYLSGVEIQTRIRIAYRSQSNNKENELLAKAITHKTYYDQERLDIPHLDSHKFKDGLICGISWSNVYLEDGDICYEVVNPFNILPDMDDLTPEMTDSDYVVRLRWVSFEKSIKLWPSHKEYFNSMFESSFKYKNVSTVSGEIAYRLGGFQNVYSSGNGSFGSKILIIEVQNKKTRKSYKGFDYQGHHFETFSEKDAEELIYKKSEMQEGEATQIMRGVFTGDCLLEHAPLNPNIPNMKDFTYIPHILWRRFEDGVPEGIISVMKEPQRESNYRRAKLIEDLSSMRIFIDPEAIDGQNPQEILQNLKRSDSLNFVKDPNKNIIIDNNSKLSDPQFRMLTHADQEIQQASGIYSDALGDATNATSGVAIKNRQINSVRNQVFYFDNFKNMKKRTGKMFLALLQASGNEFMQANILDEDEQQSVILNMSRDIKGKRVMFNDIRTIPMGIEVEEVPDFTSSLDERRSDLETLMNNPRFDLIVQSEELLRQLNIRDYKAISSEMKAIMQQNQQPSSVKQGQQQQDVESILSPAESAI